MEVVAKWMNQFETRADVRTYLLANRDRTDRREFLIPAKLPLKLFTAAALAIVDRDPEGCSLIAEAEAEMAPLKGEITDGRLARLKAAAAGLCE